MPITPIGSVFKYGAKDADMGAMSTLGNVSSISDSGDTYSITEYAALDSGYATKLAGRRTPGTVTVEFYYESTAGTGNFVIIEDLADGQPRAFGIEFSDDSTWHGNGIISQTPTIDVGEDVVRCTITIERTELWTQAA